MCDEREAGEGEMGERETGEGERRERGGGRAGGAWRIPQVLWGGADLNRTLGRGLPVEGRGDRTV